MLRPVPITLKQANALISSYHRHHAPVVGLRFAIGCEKDGKLVGAAIVGRPVARMTDQYNVAEVTRLVTDGTKNACSCLYSACARAADAMGYQEIQTFILETEPGTSLLASGWEKVGRSAGGDWNRPSRGGRRTDQPQVAKTKYRKRLGNWDPRRRPAPPASGDEQAQEPGLFRCSVCQREFDKMPGDGLHVVTGRVNGVEWSGECGPVYEVEPASTPQTGEGA